MKKFTLVLMVLLMFATGVSACDIFSSNVVTFSPTALTATIPVPAVVQSQTYHVATPFAAPVVLQQSVPVVSSYNISSVQPVIGVNSFVPTGVRFRSAGAHGFAANVVVNRFGNQVAINRFGQRVIVDRFGNQVAINKFGQQVAINRFGNQVLVDRFGNRVRVDRFGNRVRVNGLGARVVNSVLGRRSFVARNNVNVFGAVSVRRGFFGATIVRAR